MESLPLDIFYYLLLYVTLNDLVSLLRVNKLFQQYGKNETMWKSLHFQLMSRKPAVVPKSINEPSTYCKRFKALHLTQRLKVYRKNRCVGTIWFYPTNTLFELISLIYAQYEELQKYGCIYVEKKIERKYERCASYYINQLRLLSKFPLMQVQTIPIESLESTCVNGDLHVIAFGDHDLDFHGGMIRGEKAQLKWQQQRAQQWESFQNFEASGEADAFYNS